MLVGTAPPPKDTTYTEMLYSAVAEAGADVEAVTLRSLVRRRYDIVHLHWPEWYLYRRPRWRMIARSSMFLAALAWARLRGSKLVWTAHNVLPHERTPPRYTALFFGVFTRLVDAVISPTEAGLRELHERFPCLSEVPTTVVPLGHLRGRYPDHRSRLLARERLGVRSEAVVATYFGNIRPYKNVPGLLRAFHAVSDPDALLLVGGRPLDDEVKTGVERAAAGDDRVRLHLDFVEDDDVQHYLRAADIVVLPYAEISNSFVALLALSFDRPILAPSLGSFPELASAVGPEWVRLYEGDLTTTLLGDAIAAARLDPPEAARPDLEPFSWPMIGTATVAAYRAVVD